jgi:hypothetical protein
MNEQRTLEFEPPEIDNSPAGSFHRFHEANPHVYKTLVFKCRQWRKRHREEKLGIRMLWESMRWDFAMKTETTETPEFKLNNNYTSFYARIIMDNNPELRGIFEIRSPAGKENA